MAVACGVIGQPEMPMATVAGDLEKDWPELNEEQVVEAISKESPAVRIAEAAEGRAQSVLMQARRGAIPDVQLRGGLEYNHETLGSVPYAKGWEGIAEVSRRDSVLQIGNQGNVAAARADIDARGRKETDCVDAARTGRVRSRPVRKCTVDGDGISPRKMLPAREESVWIDGGQIRADARSYPRSSIHSGNFSNCRSNISRRWKASGPRPLAAGLSVDGRPGGARAAGEVDSASARNERADAGTNDVAPRTRTQP